MSNFFADLAGLAACLTFVACLLVWSGIASILT